MYKTDLATIHHAGFSGFAAAAAPGLLAELQSAGIDQGLVVDLGCGSGVWLRELTRAGYAGWGIDASPAMIRIARRTAPAATLGVADLARVRLPRCDAVTAIGEVLCYRPERGMRRFGWSDGLSKIAAALRPGGLLLFDVLVQAAGPPMRYRSWQAGDSWAVLVDVREDPARRLLIRDIEAFRRAPQRGGRSAAGKTYRRSLERHVLDVLARREVEARLRALGFSVRVSRRYGEVELPLRRLAFMARKRKT